MCGQSATLHCTSVAQFMKDQLSSPHSWAKRPTCHVSEDMDRDNCKPVAQTADSWRRRKVENGKDVAGYQDTRYYSSMKNNSETARHASVSGDS